MKTPEELETEIDVVSSFASRTIEWCWKHEDEAYREGTFESVCFAISDFILELEPHVMNGYISGEEISNKLKLTSRKNFPPKSEIKKLIMSQSGVFTA